MSIVIILSLLGGAIVGALALAIYLDLFRKPRHEYACGVGIFECHNLLFDLVANDGTKKRCRNWMHYTDETKEFLSVSIHYEDGKFPALSQIGTYSDIKHIIHDGDKFVPYKYVGEDGGWNTTFKRV